MPLRRFLIKTWKVLASHSLLWACKTPAPFSYHNDNMNVSCFSQSTVTLVVLYPSILSCLSIFFLFGFPFLYFHSPSTIMFGLSLIWSEGKNRRKRGSVNNSWALPPRKWGIMIRMLVPLLCRSVPTVKVGYATERAETKQLFWEERLCFPPRDGVGEAIPAGQKDKSNTTKTSSSRGPGNHLYIGCIIQDNYLDVRVVTGEHAAHCFRLFR